MSKATTRKFSGMSWLLAASLAATLAAYGCSSNQYAGNGQPTPMTPTINSVNHSTTYGSSSGTEGNPPMTSSYVNPSARRVDVDALAILAAEQGFRGRVLGPVNPDGSLSGVTIASGQFVSPAQQVYPQSTVNSSINSQPTPVIGSDVGITIAANGTTGAATTGATPVASTAATTAATTAAPAAATGALTTSTGAGSTVAGSASFSPALMNSTPAPQATGTTSRTLPTLVATGRATGTNTKSASTARSTSTTSAARTASVNVVSGIQLQTSANGAIMMTNVVNTAPTVKGK
jgi:hypothetical protein